MNEKDDNIRKARLISGGGFADPNHEQPHTPAEFDYYWNVYLASGDVECLAKAIEITEIYGNKKVTKEIAKILRDREPTQKFKKAIKRIERDVLYRQLIKRGMRKEAIYSHLATFQGIEKESVKRELMQRRKKVTKK